MLGELGYSDAEIRGRIGEALGRRTLALRREVPLGESVLSVSVVRGEAGHVARFAADEESRNVPLESRCVLGCVDTNAGTDDLHQGVGVFVVFAVCAAAFWAWVHRATISDSRSGVKA